MSKLAFTHDVITGLCQAASLSASFEQEGSVVELTRDRAGQPWRARHREILSRMVRETEPPTDSLPRITDPGAQSSTTLTTRGSARCSILPGVSVPS